MIRLGKLGGVIEIIIGIVGHRENLAGVDVHNDAAHAAVGQVVVIRLLEIFLQHRLDGIVERQHNVGAVDRIDIAFILERQLIAVRVLPLDGAAVDAGQQFVIGQLDAIEAGVVAADRADDLRGKRAEGIVALGAFLEADLHRELVFLDKAADGFLLLALHILFDDLIAAAFLGRALADIVLIHAQNFIQAVYNQFLLRVVLDVAGRDEHGLHRGADGQLLHRAVIDRPALGVDGDLVGVLEDGVVAVFVGMNELQLGQTVNHKTHQQQDGDDGRAAAVQDSFVGCFGVCHVRSLPFLFGLHRKGSNQTKG